MKKLWGAWCFFVGHQWRYDGSLDVFKVATPRFFCKRCGKKEGL